MQFLKAKGGIFLQSVEILQGKTRLGIISLFIQNTQQTHIFGRNMAMSTCMQTKKIKGMIQRYAHHAMASVLQL